MRYKIDAQNKILGRLASEIAIILRGKNFVTFTPNTTSQVKVDVINASKLKVSGDKAKQKVYWHYSGYPGGIKQEVFEKIFAKNPERILRSAVYGMLPKNRLRNRILKNLQISA